MNDVKKRASEYRKGIVWARMLTAVLIAITVGISNADTQKVVKANAALLKLLTIETVQHHDLQDSLKLSAHVDLDHQRIARIGSAVTGRITEIQAILGQSVNKGQQLALLNSSELGQAQSEYLKANSQVNIRRLAVQRAERLLSSDVIAAAELQERQGALTEAEVDLKTARDQLRVLGMSEQDLKRLDRERTIHSFSSISASISGVVIERNVTLGQVVQPADTLYTIADLSQVWIVAEVPEIEAHWVSQGDQVEAEIPALPGLTVKGQLIYISDMVNPETRTVTVRIALPNPERKYKPQMLATLKINKRGEQLLAIPSQAVVRDNDQDWVFIQTAPGEFKLHQVDLGNEENGMRQLLGGLQVGDKIVTKGGFHLNNERLRTILE